MEMKWLKKIFGLDRGFYRQVVVLALPIALQSLISIGVNMLDTVMLGRLGEAELSAASLANQFISIYHIFCMGIGMGASVLVSRYWGMRELEPEKSMTALKKTICIMLRITVVLAIVFAGITLLAPERVMRMYTDSEGIIERGVIYLRYSVVTYFFLGLSLVCTIVLRSVGQVKMPLFVSIGTFFVNLVANYGLIFGKLGMPRLGIAGAAVATMISRLFEAAVICGYLFAFDKKIRFRPRHFIMKTGDLLGEYIRISIPVLISDAILAFGNNAVAMVIGRLGDNFVAANAITSVTQQLSNVMIQGVCQAGAIMTGQTLGENSREKAQDQAFGFLGVGFILGLLSAGFIMLVSRPVISFYHVGEQTAGMAQQLMEAISLIVVFQATNSIMTKGVLRGGGDTKMLMLADNIFLWVLSIPLGIVAAFLWGAPPFWIYISLKADQIAKAVWCICRLQSGKWVKKIYTGKNTAPADGRTGK